jgi:hypothetical protein
MGDTDSRRRMLAPMVTTAMVTNLPTQALR